jgi:triacylglycerol esterase/lipase EstA (alpha/beta hydrolase family)
VSLRLEPPPVLLVHGLWSDSSAWNGLRDFLKNKGYPICEGVGCTVNYGPIQPAPSFDPLAGELENQFAVNHLMEATATALQSLRQEGIAATQVDVVAHSLGGLIARARVALTDPARAYRRPDNFQRGDFHKLITVGTPHRGTPLADFLVAHREARPTLFGGLTVEEYLGSIGRPFGRAIEEMQSLSPAIANLGTTTNIPSHAIVGVAPKESETEQSLDFVLGSVAFLTTADAMLGGNGLHDTIVPRSSQAGGLAGRAVTPARRTVHTDVSGQDLGETESPVIWRRIAQLLRAPVRSKLFGNFTALETNGVADFPQSD